MELLVCFFAVILLVKIAVYFYWFGSEEFPIDMELPAWAGVILLLIRIALFVWCLWVLISLL